MYTQIPAVETSTPAERLQALKDAASLAKGTPGTPGMAQAFVGGDGQRGIGLGAGEITGAIRLAEYITTGHDYRDTHPTGRRFDELQRLNDTDEDDHHGHAHVHAVGIPREVVEHLLQGDSPLEKILKDILDEANTSDDDNAADNN